MCFDLTINGYPLIYIPWNLFLLIIPFFLFFSIDTLWRKRRGKALFDKFALAVITLFWLLFLPNAAYVIVDVRHLNGFCEVSQLNNCLDGSWMIMLFFTYAFLGWVALVYNIKLMHDFLASIIGKFKADIFEIIIIPLISLGVLLGLIQRWNSWDIFTAPGAVISDAIIYFYHWPYIRIFLVYSFFLYILYYGGSLMFKRKLK
ncbi:DUF1361 domain-containing protein [Candidatus Parcubacteria bacterium]|nr:DUF1361 domain-containing protein [Candidatus Parcubacteria bacterium]